MKPCIRCGASKPLNDFYTHPQMGDGHLNKCKECCKQVARDRHDRGMLDAAWVMNQRERGRSKHKRLGYGRSAPSLASRSWRSRYPEKGRAHVAVYRAVKAGQLIRPETCEACGERRSIHAHHQDYSKPLVVNWLCADCHMKLHRKPEPR